MASHSSIKTYEFLNQSRIESMQFKITHNGQPIFRSECNSTWKGPLTTITLPESTSTVLAACTAQSWGWSKNMNLVLGDPKHNKAQEAASGSELKRESLSEKRYTFAHDGRTFAWSRTHDKALGAHRWGDRDFVLVDESCSPPRVLAVWVNNMSSFKRNPEAVVEWFVELGRELELLSLAAVLAIEDRVRAGSVAAIGG